MNVVLLSGLGTRSPVLDFAPLTRALQTRARVTVVEYPGYGWSDDTDRPRSTAASVEETREALRLAGLRPPYVLVAHSISGLQTLVWANSYPEEVAGVVGLDSTVPGQLPFMPSSMASDPNVVLGVLGIVRLALLVQPSLSGAPTDELTSGEARDFGMITNWNIASSAIANETSAVLDNLKATQGLTYPRTMPVTLVLASERGATGIPGEFWKAEHQRLVEGNSRGKVVVLPGIHSIHHGNAQAVADLVFSVLDD